MFNALFAGLAALLNFFYTVWPSYGFAIGMLTVAVMVFAFPLTAKSMRSMAAMTKLQPELRQIQAKYKNDRQKQSEETMALFKEHGVSPVSGCLPLLIQAPVFIVMFRVLRGLTNIPKGHDGFKPKYLSHSSELYRALEGKHHMHSMGMDLAKSASQALKVSFVSSIPFLVLIAASVGLGYYQQYMITKRNPQGPAADDNPMAKQMQTFTKVMPLMYLVWGFAFPAGLNVYFVVSAALRIGQQALIYKLDPNLLPGHGAAQTGTKTKPESPKPGSPKPGAKETPPAPPPGPASKNGGGNGKAPGKPAPTGNRRKKKKR